MCYSRHRVGGVPSLTLSFPQGGPSMNFPLLRAVCLVAQSYLTFCDPMCCTPPGSSVHGDSPRNMFNGWERWDRKHCFAFFFALTCNQAHPQKVVWCVYIYITVTIHSTYINLGYTLSLKVMSLSSVPLVAGGSLGPLPNFSIIGWWVRVSCSTS